MDYNFYLILTLIILIATIITIYLCYFCYDKLKHTREQIEENSFDLQGFYEKKKESKVKKTVSYVLIGIFFLFSVAFFTTNIVVTCNNNIFYLNNQYVVSIESTSMQNNLITNSYLHTNGLTHEKLYLHDIAVFDEIDSIDDLNVFDIILFEEEVEGKKILIAHRILNIENGLITTRGDSNPESDEPIEFDQVKGKYSHSDFFLSFLNSASKSVNFYVIFGFVVLDFLIYEFFTIKREKMISNYQKTNCEAGL